MPIYEYQCTDCGHSLEILQKMNDDALTTCPNCKKEALKKQVTAAAFKLKGSGWYETDFKKKPATENTEKKDTSTKSDGKSTESTTKAS